ncbi:hypothetical protein NQ314_002087 [Rhamnusium bicolor]|uniref:Transposable element P transposase n=1 Tax=Rhamnusium bicolor TaxID=1586634 RepID=A0AAV8ZSQ6_9CUCU|nr:hypothetical protein NQ314_002087 [Rhamnusium bicolor]
MVIKSVRETGLKVVATGCDQHANNVQAIKELRRLTREECLKAGKEDEYFGFTVDGQEVVPLYDVPHLLKGVRNRTMEADKVTFKWKKEHDQTATWDTIIKAYEWDCSSSEYRMLYRLTDSYLCKDKMKKMKVNLAVQVFSQRISMTIGRMHRLGLKDLPEAEGTAAFFIFIDKLSAVKEESGHVEFWYEAIKVLRTVKFHKKGKQSVPPSIKNWIHTLKGFIYLWSWLKQDNFTFMCTRNFNQDPLENFFCYIRSHGVRNINPTCTHFRQSFTSLLVNNFMAPHSPGANCEQDESDGALDNLNTLIKTNVSLTEVTGESKHSLVLPPCEAEDINTNDVTGISTYVAGFVAKIILKKIGVCKVCRTELVSDSRYCEEYKYLHIRAYNQKALLYPTTNFMRIFKKYSLNM